MFSKTVIQRIVNLWGIGASAEETVTALRDEDVKISLHCVYNIRRGLTAQQMIDELQREQQRDIAKCDTPALKMKYRDLLLAKLIPQQKDRIEVNVNATASSTSESTVKLLSEYDALIAAEMAKEKSNIQPDSPPEQVHPA